MCDLLKIGSLKLRNRVVSAPMAGITDVGFRYLAWEMGVGLNVTEMATSRGIVQKHKRTLRTIETHPQARPYSVQIFGDDADILAEAARAVQDMGADVLDFNAACPVKKVIRSGSGALYLKDMKRLARTVAAIRRAITIPFTIKVRSGWDADTIVVAEVSKIASEEGVDALTLHPRTAVQGFGGRADWRLIGEAVSVSKIPVIASGDICGASDALEVIRQTGCAGVMIGRAAMGNPFVYREMVAATQGAEAPDPPTPEKKYETVMRHLELMLEYHQHKTAITLWRKHLTWYLRGLPDAAKLRNKVFSMWNVEELCELARVSFLEPEGSRALVGANSL